MQKRRLIQLITLIPEFNDQDIAELAIYDYDNNLLVSGEIVYSVMTEYMLRYCYLAGESLQARKADYIFNHWQGWLLYRRPDIIKIINALTAEYDPLNDYAMHETETKLHNDGEDTVTIKNKYDYTTTDGATTGDTPTYSNYVTTFDNTQERLESKRQDTGSRTVHTLAADEDKNVKTTSYTHTEAEMTIGTDTISADKIDHKTRDVEGHSRRSAQELTQQTIDLYKQSALRGLIDDFFAKHSFYVGEGRCRI